MPETEPHPFAGRTLQSLAKSLTHHTNRLRARAGAAERLQIHVMIWPDSPAASRLAELRDEMVEDWEQCKKYATEIMRRIASLMDELDPNRMKESGVQTGEVAADGHGNMGAAHRQSESISGKKPGQKGSP